MKKMTNVLAVLFVPCLSGFSQDVNTLSPTLIQGAGSCCQAAMFTKEVGMNLGNWPRSRSQATADEGRTESKLPPLFAGQPSGWWPVQIPVLPAGQPLQSFWQIHDFRLSPRGFTLDHQGRLLLLGTSEGRSVVKRFLTTGQADHTFGHLGSVSLNFSVSPVSARSLAVDGKGRIVLAGTGVVVEGGSRRTIGIVLRLLASGDPDLGFGEAGAFQLASSELSFSVNRVVTDKFDRPVFTGSSTALGSVEQQVLLVRLTESGKPDASFESSGLEALDCGRTGIGRDVQLDRQGRLIVAVQNNVQGRQASSEVGRYEPDGRPDHLFGEQGAARLEVEERTQPAALALDHQNRIILIGTSLPIDGAPDVLVARFTSEGNVDKAFGKAGLTTIDLDHNPDFGQTVALTAQGAIYVGVYTNSTFTTLHLGADGRLDPAFKACRPLGEAGEFGEPLGISGVLLDAQEKLITVGGPGATTFVALCSREAEVNATDQPLK